MSAATLTAVEPHRRLAMAMLSSQPGRWIPEPLEDFFGTVSWEKFLGETDDRVKPYLHWMCTQSPYEDCVPAEVRGALGAEHRAASLRSLRWAAELREIHSAFAHKCIDLMLLKGSALQRTVYPLPSTRPMSDIDLLVRREELGRVAETLTTLGFVRRSSPECQTPVPGLQVDEETYFVKRVGNSVLLVEVHTRIDFGDPDLAISSSALWDRRTELPGSDGLTVATPEPDLALRHLCMHLAKQHSFERGLLWLLDLRLFVANQGANLQWPRFLGGCHAKSLPYISCALDLASDWLGAEVPREVTGLIPDTNRVAAKDVAWQQMWDFVRTRRPPGSVVLLGMSGDRRRIARYLKDKWQRWTLPAPEYRGSRWMLAAKRFRTELKTYAAAARQGGFSWHGMATLRRTQSRAAQLEALLSGTAVQDA